MSICVAFTGGGTGGHIYPGLAVAEQFKSVCKENADISSKIIWIGSSKGMDKRIVESNSIVDKFYGIPSGKLRRYFSFRNVLDVFKIFAGFFTVFFILLKNKPAVLFSKGGFVSVPPCFAAKILGIPVYTHECDFSPGLATKLNTKAATKVLLSYKQTEEFFLGKNKEKLVVTGNPVRPAFYSASAKKGREFLGLEEKTDKPVLVVIGGSLGAKQINELIYQNIDFLCEHFIVVHQTGTGNEVAITEKLANDSYKPYSFIYGEMPDVLAAADIILSRAGANSLWECAVLKKPMVLVPLCGSGTRGDQVENAKFFEENNAAMVLLGDDADSEHLKNALTKMLDKTTRKAFADSCSNMVDKIPPARKIADLIFMGVVSK